ncbi:hypothetical protein [Endozoicomonas sp. ONNA1]|uniref:hypothetical protein n=1 Tax=Endozoicomonas sp. ONNA1 TaxID=2828740 RepID=UPI002147545A|nr:hypothetical protein [Endozoicomonas sp. ONNA1]
MLLLSLSAVCHAEALTRVFIVELEQNEVFPNQSFSIKRDRYVWLGSPSDAVGKNDYTETDSPPDNKAYSPDGYGVKMTLIESVSWQWLYATPLLVAYKLILTTKDASLSSNPYSRLPLEVADAVVTVSWLLKSYWNPDSALFKPIEQQEACQDHPFATITMMFGSGPNQQQSSESPSQKATGARSQPASSFITPPDSHSGGDNGDPNQHLHTLSLNCFIHPCNGACQYRPSSNNREPAGSPLKSLVSSAAQTGATPEKSSCPRLHNKKKHSRIDHFDFAKAIYSQQKSLFELLNNPSGISGRPSQSQAHQPQPCGISGKPTNNRNHEHSVRASAAHIDLTGPISEAAQIHGSSSVSNDDLVIVNGLLNLGNHILLEEIGVSCAYTDFTYSMRTSETQQATGSSQLGQSPRHLSQTGAFRTPAVAHCRGATHCQQALPNQESRKHSGQQTCDVTMIGEDGQPKPCGAIFKNARSQACHRSRYHSGEKTCDLTVDEGDGRQRPCGKVFKHAQALSIHKNRGHTGQQTCIVNVIGEDGQQRPCGTVCENIRAMAIHKRNTHRGQKTTCEVIVVGEGGQSRQCGTICKNAQTLTKRKRHRKRTSVDVDQDRDNDLNP